MPGRPHAIIYVDGFNLYKSALQFGNPDCKWLDLVTMSEKLFPHFEIIQVKYFAARLKSSLHDPDVHRRQSVYLRALESVPEVSIYLGHFAVHKQHLPLHPEVIDPISGKRLTAYVRRSEEKGSDVNIATQMLLDGFSQAADVFVLVSLDSDLQAPLQALKTRMGLSTGIVFPNENVSKKLLEAQPEYVRHLRSGLLRESQFPNQVLASDGTIITKPVTW